MTIQPDAQGGLWDVVIENEELEHALESRQSYVFGHKQYVKADRAFRKMMPDLEGGTRYRIGRFVVVAKPIAGGGFEIPNWESQSYEINALD